MLRHNKNEIYESIQYIEFNSILDICEVRVYASEIDHNPHFHLVNENKDIDVAIHIFNNSYMYVEQYRLSEYELFILNINIDWNKVCDSWYRLNYTMDGIEISRPNYFIMDEIFYIIKHKNPESAFTIDFILLDDLGKCAVKMYEFEGEEDPHFHIINNSVDITISLCSNTYNNMNPMYILNSSQCKMINDWLNKISYDNINNNWNMMLYHWNSFEETKKVTNCNQPDYIMIRRKYNE